MTDEVVKPSGPAAAKPARVSTAEFARTVLANPGRYDKQTVKTAQLAKTMLAYHK